MKKMRKFLAALVCAATVVGSFSGAATVMAAESTQDQGTPYEGEFIDIGFIGWGFTDALGGSYKAYFDYMSEAFGINFNLVVGITQEEHYSLAESLIESGVEGIMCYQVTSSLMELCENNGVYLMQYGSPVTDEELLAYLKECDYWLGCSTVDDYASGQNMVEALYEAGCRNIIALSVAAGNPCHDLRWNGIMDKAAEYEDMNVIGEYRSPNIDAAQGYADQTQNFLAMYAEMDGVALTGASNGCCEAVLQSIDTAGLTGEVKLATIDVVDGTDAFLEEGSLLFVGGGQYPEVVFLAVVMADAIRGNLDIPGQDVYLVGQFINIVGKEGYETYEEYIMNEFPYTVEELQAVSKTFNPDAGYQDLYDLWNSYNIEDVMTRHQH